MIACDCCSARLDFLHEAIAYSDTAVAKAAMVPEVAQIARIEARAWAFMVAKWNNRAIEASAAAARVASRGGKPSAIHAAVNKAMNKWAPETAPAVSRDSVRAYKLARQAGWDKASGRTKASLQYQLPGRSEGEAVEKASGSKPKPSVNVSFDLADKKAAEDLANETAVWIGRHYDDNVKDAVRTAVTPAILEGLGRAEAGRAVEQAVRGVLGKVETPSGFHGSSNAYFEGVAANTITNARVRGQLRSFRDLGIVQFILVNPMDDRTSEICRHMDGKIFTVDQAWDQIEKLSGLTDPADIKSVAPWPSMKTLLEISPKPGNVSADDAKLLAEAGVMIPPFHFRCRTTVDVV